MSRCERRRPSNTAAAVGCAAALVTLAACGGGSSGNGAGANGPAVPGAGVLVGKVEPLDLGSLTAKQVAADSTAFGFSLFTKLCTAAPSANLTISPASAAQALGMLDAGSSGTTRAKVGRLLHLPDWDSHVVAALAQQTAALDKVDQIKVSNHVFEQEGLAPTQQTLDDLKTAYNADLRQVDFADGTSATDAINEVISHDTDALIPKLFDRPLDASTRTVLANAILLDAKWQTPFPSSDPGTFHSADGSNVTTSMMDNSEASFPTREADGWKSVVLPYQGGTLQAVAMLPPVTDGSPSAVSKCPTPSPDVLASLTTGTSTGEGVVLPKLDLSQTLPLTDTLAKLGLPLVGDYTGLGKADNEISEVVQKVVMKVDEQGTKAAAATGVGITTSARVANQVVSFDRPFLLLLEDTETGTPLFLARVADPTAH